MQIEVTALREPTAEDKLTPQAKVIFTTLIDKVGLNTPMDRAELIKELDSNGDLVTRQGASRVFTFYQGQFVEKGLMSITRPTPQAKAPAEGKERQPAKGKASAVGAKPAEEATA
jgi:hypothetical protein